MDGINFRTVENRLYALQNVEDNQEFNDSFLMELERNATEIESCLFSMPPGYTQFADLIGELFKRVMENSEKDDFFIESFNVESGRLIPTLKISFEERGMSRVEYIEKEPEWPVLGIKDRKEADFLTRSLYFKKLCWDYREGCYARAELGCYLLRFMGVPSEKIKKIWIRGSIELKTLARGGRKAWTWHIAPLVISESGEKFVIDPAVNKEKALTTNEWRNSFSKGPGPISSGEINGNWTYLKEGHKQRRVTQELFQRYKEILKLQRFYECIIHGFEKYNQRMCWDDEACGIRESKLFHIALKNAPIPYYDEELEGQHKDVVDHESRVCIIS